MAKATKVTAQSAVTATCSKAPEGSAPVPFEGEKFTADTPDGAGWRIGSRDAAGPGG